MANSRKSKSADLSGRVAAQLAPLLPAHSSILVGLSGGVDSVALLHLLHDLAPRFSWRLSALHVHHGISPNAGAWAEFCSGLCTRLGIPLIIEHVDIAPLRGEHGIEAAARQLRHAALARQPCDFVALAHHADDQAETLLLQLLRGAGVKGAAAMPVLSSVEGPVLSRVEGPVLITSDLPACGRSRMASSSTSRVEEPVPAQRHVPALVRPLLNFSRQEILDYAAACELQWVEDESNADDSYPRNFLRHRVLPLLEQRFPACRATLARSARHFAEAGELLDELARQDAGQVMDAATLDVSALGALGSARARNLLRYFLHCQGAPMPQAVQLDDMLRQLCEARHDAAVCVAFGGWQLRRYRGRAHAMPSPGDFDHGLVLPWNDEEELAWPALDGRVKFEHVQGEGVCLAKLRHAPVTLRLRSGGETLRPYLHAATRSLKNLLQEHGVPPWRRERLPLLYCGNELVCVAGVAVAAEYQAGPGEAGVRLLAG